MKLDLEISNTYVIGDVHGCYYTLKKLLNKIPINSNIIFTGDLLDKGFFSKKVIQLIKNNDNYHSVQGNHETFFIKYGLDYFNTHRKNLWTTSNTYGGKFTMDNYSSLEELTEDINFIKSLPTYIEIKNFYITHGYGLPYYKRRKKIEFKRAIQNNRISLENYKKEYEDFKNYNIINIFGHDNFDEIIIGKKYVAIDTGCVYGNKLTALRLSDFSIIQVNKDLKD